MKIKGEIRRTPKAIAIPPNFGVGSECTCLLPGRAIALLLNASNFTDGTATAEMMKAVKKIIKDIKNKFIFKI